MSFERAGFYKATDGHLCYNKNQPCHSLVMAWLRADRGFNTFGAPPLGGERAPVL